MITVLYEDAPAAGARPNNYAPHQLLQQCVADRLGRSGYWELASVTAIPCRGRDKLVAKLRDDRIYNAGPVVAVLDHDKVRDADPGLRGACRTQILGWLRAPGRCPSPQRLTPVLLQENLETVLTAAIGLQPSKPSPLQRDLLLQPVIAPGPEGWRRRQALLADVPSFAYLVGKLTALVRAAEA